MKAANTVGRDDRIRRLKAFALFVNGQHTLYQIAEAIGIAEINPSTAAGRARTRVAQGWRLIVDRKVERWRRYWDVKFPGNGWQTLHGARLWTHPRAEPPPPAPPPRTLTPLEQLLEGLGELEAGARRDGLVVAADGIRNMIAALRHRERERAALESKARGR